MPTVNVSGGVLPGVLLLLRKVDGLVSKLGREYSAPLLAAQLRLQILRERHSVNLDIVDEPLTKSEHGRFAHTSRVHSNLLPEINNQLPAHLGWESAPLTTLLRLRRENHKRADQLQVPHSIGPISTDSSGINPVPAFPINVQTIKLYPDVALAMLRHEAAAAGRIWLLLRYIDGTGRGWLSLDETREKITKKDSSLRVCGWRQLRNLLNKGEGIFWQRQNGRIWLNSVAKVAAALQVWRLNGRPIAIPVFILCQGIGQVRAHLYASFHSGRTKRDKISGPITRNSLAQICRINKRTQRRYDKRANVKKKHNFAVGPLAQSSKAQEIAWQQGRATFMLTDIYGRHGQKGKTYLAWQLPNSYIGPHTHQPRGRQKRINMELADLFMKGMTGNGQPPLNNSWRPKRYCENGRHAAKICQQVEENQPVYWPSNTLCNHSQLWYVLQGRMNAH